MNDKKTGSLSECSELLGRGGGGVNRVVFGRVIVHLYREHSCTHDRNNMFSSHTPMGCGKADLVVQFHFVGHMYIYVVSRFRATDDFSADS